MSKMKVLLCSPYLEGENVVPGGIGVWGQSILDYHKSVNSHDWEIHPVSFDRHQNIGEVTDFGIKRFYNGIKELSGKTYKASKMLLSDTPDVVHICTSASLGLLKDLILLYVAKKKKVRSVLHLHFGRTKELQQSKNWEWKLLSKAVKLADTTIAMDSQTYQVLSAGKNINVKYVPNPLSLKVSSAVERLGEQDRVPNQLLFVGHVLKTKGVYELVRGCVKVSNAKLCIIGKCDSVTKDELVEISKVRDNGDWLSFGGELPQEQVLSALLSSDIFVFPSYTEGFPNVIIEAMACGCPIVSSRVGAIPEMLDVDGEKCGICIAPQNSELVTSSVLYLLNNPELKKEMAKKAKQRVYEKYSVPVVWNMLTDIWRGK